MWDFLREINARGTTIILTTHYLEEAETLCRNIAIINGGLIAERDRMSTLLRKLQAETFVLNLREAITAVPQVPGYEFDLIDEHTLEVEVSKEQSLNEVFASLTAQGIGVLSMRNKVNRLEELFMKLVERKPARRRARHERHCRANERRRTRPGRCARPAGSGSRPSSFANTDASSASGRRPSCLRRSRRRCIS
jgi:ABC-type sulfate/molybdate transport systems ATPase subunit